MSVLLANAEKDNPMEPVEVMNVSFSLTRPAPTRQQIQCLQSVIAEMPQLETEERHYFVDGVYGRVLPLKAGSVIVGKTHKRDHIVMLIKGTVTLNTESGMETLSAPAVWVSKAGAKRAIAAHDDCELMTAHPNPDNLTDMGELETYLIEPEVLKLRGDA